MAEAGRLSAGLARWDPREVSPLVSRAQEAALGSERLTEQDSAGVGSLTAVAPTDPSGVGRFGGASGSGSGAGSDGASGSGGYGSGGAS